MVTSPSAGRVHSLSLKMLRLSHSQIFSILDHCIDIYSLFLFILCVNLNAEYNAKRKIRFNNVVVRDRVCVSENVWNSVRAGVEAAQMAAI